VVREENLRILLAFAVQHDLEIHQLDVDSAYLYSPMDREIFMEQPEGFVNPDFPDHVCRLDKGLYGARQAGFLWHNLIDSHFIENGFHPTEQDPCIYVCVKEEGISIIALFVDDNTVICNKQLLKWTKQVLSGRFNVKDLGEATSVLGKQLIRNREEGTLILRQEGYIDKILTAHNMQECRPAKIPMQPGLHLPLLKTTEEGAENYPYSSLVGDLIYLAISTRPDILYAASYLSRFNKAHGKQHWEAALQVLRYLNATRTMSIVFHRTNTPPTLIGYSDADWGGNIDRKSISGYFFTYAGAIVQWKSKRQSTIALSSTEAEYLSNTEAARQAVYLRRLLHQIGQPQSSPTKIFTDNQGAKAIAEDKTIHSRTKHFDIRHHWIRKKVQSGGITLRYCPSTEMIADMLTKALPRVKFEYLRDLCGLRDVPSPNQTYD